MKVRFEATIELPEGTPVADIEKWLDFELGRNCVIEIDNALMFTDIQSVGCSNISVKVE